jgi:hypothetical protein
MRAAVAAAAAAASLCALACSRNVADLMRDKQRGLGDARVYEVDRDTAWTIALAVFRADGWGKISEFRARNYAITDTPVLAGRDFMEVQHAGVWIEPDAAGHTRVTYVVEPEWSEKPAILHQRFERAVASLRAGKPLDASLPPGPSGVEYCEQTSDCAHGSCIEHGCR